MILDYSTPRKLKLDMKEYIDKMIEEFPETLKESNYLWNENLFKEDEEANRLSKERAELFHKIVAKDVFAK